MSSVSDVSLQDNETFVEQSFNTEVVSYFYLRFWKFMSNFLKILKNPLWNVIASACIVCRLLCAFFFFPVFFFFGWGGGGGGGG